MYQVQIVVNDQGQLQLQSNIPNKLALIDLLAQATRAVIGDIAEDAKKAAPRVVAAPEGALRVLPRANG